MSKEFIEKYITQKKRLKEQFEKEKTGDQTLYIDQSKLFKPLIETQKETQKETQQQIVTGQENLNNALIPLVQEIKKRNDQVELLQGLPFFNIPEIEGATQSTPKVTPQKDKLPQYIDVDLDGALLDETHKENLQDLNLDLPSEVLKKGNYETVISRIHTENRRIGQYLRDDSKKSEREKEMYKSQKITLELYKNKIEGLKEATQLFVSRKTGEGMYRHKLVKQKKGRGRPKTKLDLVVYSNLDDLATKLNKYITAKEAGNTGVDNYITEILDELLEKKGISIDEHNKIFQDTFFRNSK